MIQNNLPSFIINNKCKKESAEICNLHRACDACPYERKSRMKHKHKWEEKETSLKLKYIQCMTCKKISYPNRTPQIHIRKGKISYITKGAFGTQNKYYSSIDERKKI